jgi:septal ring factor EnvC (AmiA/AmiB activator)
MKRMPTKPVALAKLKCIAATELSRLRKLKTEILDPQAEADRAEAPLRALLEVDAETLAWQRYEVQLDRSLRGSVAELTKLRKANAAEAEAGEKAAAERARRERKTGSVDRGPYVPSTPISRNEPSAPAGAEGLQGPQGVVAAPETVVSGSH